MPEVLQLHKSVNPEFLSLKIESFLIYHNIIMINNKILSLFTVKMEEFIFQAIDWRITQKSVEIKELKTKEKYKHIEPQESIIQIYGRNKNNKSVYVEVNDFVFYFYVKKVPNCEKSLKYYIEKPEYYKQIRIFKHPEKLKDFYYFNGEKDEYFLKVFSKNYYLLNKFGKEISDNKTKKDYDILTFPTFNRGKDGFIQFYHEKNIKPSGWIKLINPNTETIHDSKTTFSFSVSHEDIIAYDSEDITGFKLCAYDIECISCDDSFPLASRETDEIVSIACTISELGKNNIIYKCIILTKDCPDFEDVDVRVCKNEKDLILEFCKVIREQDPDFITGWNNFGFDDEYIQQRAIYHNIERKINFSRLMFGISKFREGVKLSSSALGDNIFNFYDMVGRVNFDLMRVIQRDNRLISYKLDFVVSKFFREIILNSVYDSETDTTTLTIKGNNETFHKGQYVFIIRTDCDTDYNYENQKTKHLKFQVLDINQDLENKTNSIKIDSFINPNFFKDKGTFYICNAKDDLPPKEIFEKYRNGTPEDLKKLSLYNIQDCALCNKLCDKLFILINNIAMSNTCFTTSYNIFNRGQGIRVYSIVSKKCKELNYVIPDLEKKDNENQTFEGACVIPPVPGIKPAIFCLDYAALYPRSIICKNISHEMYLKHATDNNIEKYKLKYPDYDFNRIEYNIITEKKKPKTKAELAFNRIEEKYGHNNILEMTEKDYKDTKKKNKTKVCYFAVNKDKTKIGIIPQVASDVLASRASVRKEQKKFEPHSFIWNVYEQKQLSYKVVCNSIYGALGAANGKIGLMELAACTTATGQEMLKKARNFAENTFPFLINLALKDYNLFYGEMHKLFKNSSDSFICPANKYFKISEKGNKLFSINDGADSIEELFKSIYENIISVFSVYDFKLHVEYGDTDSIFVAANLKNKITKQPVYGLELRDMHIKIGKIAESIINEILPYPENLEYEKILSPFIILSKKRYVGNLYEDDPKKFFQKNMGLVLKRRDNAPIVKYIYGGLVDKLLNTEDQKKGQKEGIEFVIKSLDDMINGKFKINYFTISKTLKSEYKNPLQIAHYVLAKRIEKRDPGNAPKANDRIDYVYIKKDEASVKLQGERIETPDYVIKNRLKIDYKFYILHQLYEPCQQIMSIFYKNTEDIFLNAVRKCEVIQSGYKMITLDSFTKKTGKKMINIDEL